MTPVCDCAGAFDVLVGDRAGIFHRKKENKEEKQKSKGMVLDIAPLNDAQ